MKTIALFLIVVAAMAFSGAMESREQTDCLLRGTPACPEYPSCYVK